MFEEEDPEDLEDRVDSNYLSESEEDVSLGSKGFIVPEDPYEQESTTKKYTSVMIRVCHSRSHFLSCMYIRDDFITESR